MNADRPKKALSVDKFTELTLGQEAAVNEVNHGRGLIDIAGDPEQGMQVTQAAFTVFDIGFDHITLDPITAKTLFTFFKFGIEEFNSTAFDDVIFKTRLNLVSLFLVTSKKASFEKSGSDGDVVLS